MCLYKPITKAFCLFKVQEISKAKLRGKYKLNDQAPNASKQRALTLPATSASLFSYQCIVGRAQRDPQCNFTCHLLAVRPWAHYLISEVYFTHL